MSCRCFDVPPDLGYIEAAAVNVISCAITYCTPLDLSRSPQFSKTRMKGWKLSAAVAPEVLFPRLGREDTGVAQGCPEVY
jgi:hypothetical protein